MFLKKGPNFFEQWLSVQNPSEFILFKNIIYLFWYIIFTNISQTVNYVSLQENIVSKELKKTLNLAFETKQCSFPKLHFFPDFSPLCAGELPVVQMIAAFCSFFAWCYSCNSVHLENVWAALAEDEEVV